MAEEDLKWLNKQENRGPSTKKLLLILVAATAVLVALLLLTSNIFPKQSQPANAQGAAIVLGAESLAVSEEDLQTQSAVKQVTGYDWPTLSGGQTGNDDEKLAALLLLWTEESTVFEYYSYVDRSEGISEEEFISLNIALVDETPTKENMAKFIDNLIELQEFYSKKGLTSAQSHIERLKFLKTYLEKYGISENSEMPKESDIITGFRIAESQKEFMRINIRRFNLWKQ